MLEKQPGDFDFGIAKGLGGLAAFFLAFFIYLRKSLGSGTNGLEKRVKDLEQWRRETEWKQDVLDEIDRRQRPEPGPRTSE